jgi:hypothetical protein
MMPTRIGKNDHQPASSIMTKNEYQTDIHELIQKGPPPTKQMVSEDTKIGI